MSDVKSFFEHHPHHHAYHRDPMSYSEIIENIRKTVSLERISVLDLGCGDGSFIRALTSAGIQGNFIGVDLSFNMVLQALNSLKGEKVGLLVGDGFNLPIHREFRFEIIHIDSVLHHLIARSKSGSKELAEKFFKLLYERLSDGGVIIVEEMYYLSFLFPELTAGAIFYGLKFLNKFGIDLSKFRPEIQPGLEVNFFSVRELKSLFKQHSGDVSEIRIAPEKIPRFYRVFLLKELGKISFAVNKR